MKKNEIRNLVFVKNNGRLSLYGLQPNMKEGREIEVMNTHHGAATTLKKNHDSSILISGGVDGSIFIYKVTEAPNKNAGTWNRKKEHIREKNEAERRIIAQVSAGLDQSPTKVEVNEGSDEDKEKEQVQAQQIRGNVIEESDDSSDQDLRDIIQQRRRGRTLYDVIDDRLSNCVLIDKSTMDEWRK